jgi:hypothetical protein
VLRAFSLLDLYQGSEKPRVEISLIVSIFLLRVLRVLNLYKDLIEIAQ